MSEVPFPEVHQIDIESLKRRNEELAQTLLEMKQDVRSQVLLSELKVEAVRAGIIDIDCIKLIDLNKVQTEDEDCDRCVAQLIRDFRLQKPWLFQSVSSSTAGAAPPAEVLAQKRVMEMSDVEYRRARAEILRQLSF